MKVSIRDFFKQGEFWTSLQQSIEKLSGRINQQAQALASSDEKSRIILLHVKHLQEENRELKERLAAIESRMWNLQIVSRTEGLTLVQPVDGQVDKPRITDQTRTGA